jgi:large-conductance mechanosensitive channel
MNIFKDCVKVVTLNNPPYIPIPFSNALVNKLFKAKKLAKSKPVITSLENKIDLSRLKVTAFETNKEINKEINIKVAINYNNFFLLLFFLYIFFLVFISQSAINTLEKKNKAKRYIFLEGPYSLESDTSDIVLVFPAVEEATELTPGPYLKKISKVSTYIIGSLYHHIGKV